MTPPAGAPAPHDDKRALVILLSVIFLNIAGFGLVIPLLPFFGKALDAPPWQITLLFSAFFAGQFLVEPFWGKLSDRVGRRRVHVDDADPRRASLDRHLHDQGPEPGATADHHDKKPPHPQSPFLPAPPVAVA